MRLDKWQDELINYQGDTCTHSGRQTGKSLAVGKKIAKIARLNPGKLTLILGPTEKQSFALFNKSLAEFKENELRKGKDRPTMHKYVLKNGHTVMCQPAGMTGAGVRFLTVFHLVTDETPYIAEAVWTAVTPMMATTKGIRTHLGTPFGQEGYYYECFISDKFKKFHISSEDCDRIPKEFLETERRRMTRTQYAQEYLGQFVGGLNKLFPDSLIRSCMTLTRGLANPPASSSGDFFLGVDVATMGADPTAIVGLEEVQDELLQNFQEEYTKERTTYTVDRVKQLDTKYDYNKIGVDGGGVGAGVFDPLLKDEQTRRKVEDLNNSKKSISKNREKGLLKEDMYLNLKVLMERGKIKLFKDDELFHSLRSVQVEETSNKTIRIHGRNTHLTEALIRAAWVAKTKRLKLWVR